MKKGGKKGQSIKHALLALAKKGSQISGKLLSSGQIRHVEINAGLASRRYSIRSYSNTSLARMHKSGLVRFIKRDRKSFLEITNDGVAKLALYDLGKLHIKKPWRWNGKWHIVSFDIKEKNRSSRDLIRETLKQLGLVRLQQSVWVYPHECREAVTLIKLAHRLGGAVLYIIAEEIENDKWLRKHFDLTF
ncbi:MAG TPA: CRISPR-associated endonuclease Cas2 [Candidatus Paceibacterota bacterium]